MNIVHFHLLMNHLPVVGALVAAVLFAAALFLRGAVSPRFALWFSVVVAAAAVVVYFTGAPAEQAVENMAGVSERAIDQHEEAAELTTIVMSVFGALSLGALLAFRSRPISRWITTMGLIGMVVITALIGWTANLGGQIRHTEIRSAATSRAVSESED